MDPLKTLRVVDAALCSPTPINGANLLVWLAMNGITDATALADALNEALEMTQVMAELAAPIVVSWPAPENKIPGLAVK